MTRLLLLLLLVLPLAAADFQPSRTSAPITPTDALRAFEGDPETDYRLGEGDEISIDVWGREDLTSRHIVGPDGQITLPLVGAVKAAGLTRSELGKLAGERWSPYYEALAVTVKVLKYDSNKILVLGRVARPGVLPYEGGITVLEAVARAGGLPVGGQGVDKAALNRCVVFRDKDKIAWIDLRSVINGSNMANNIRLRRNDTLYIPDADDQVVYVMGEVLRPGTVRLTPEMTFLDALAQAGGPTQDAKASKIHLVRQSEGIETEYAMNDLLLLGRKPNVGLQNGDIVFVPRSGMAKVGYVLQKLSPAISYGLFGKAMAN